MTLKIDVFVHNGELCIPLRQVSALIEEAHPLASLRNPLCTVLPDRQGLVPSELIAKAQQPNSYQGGQQTAPWMTGQHQVVGRTSSQINDGIARPFD